jgi:hypothetical protein
MRKMNSVVMADQMHACFIAERDVRHRGGDAIIERCNAGLAGRGVDRRRRRDRQSRVNIQSNMNGQVSGVDNRRDASVVRKPLTFARHAVCGRTEAIDLSRCWSSLDRLTVNCNPSRRHRRVLTRTRAEARVSMAGSRMFVHRMEADQSAGSGNLRMLRSGDNRLQTTVLDAFLPNYWANCLLIQQRLLALCVAEDGWAGAQWRPECPC